MKIGVVHESFQALRAVDLTLRNDGHDVLWLAESVEEGSARLAACPPDVLLLQATLRDRGAVYLTERAIQQSSAVVLLAEDAGASLTSVYEAMGSGALDVALCPRLRSGGQLSSSESLVAKLHTAARLLGRTSSGQLSVAHVPFGAGSSSSLVAIGASTGGPQALHVVLRALPQNFTARIIIVQHVDAEFVPGLAQWLEQDSHIKVRIAREGVRPTPGVALIAGADRHLVMRGDGTLGYTDEPRETPYRPSVDALFGSLAEFWRKPATAVLLTGMGRDGAAGMQKLRTLGWHTIAQDEQSSVVFGMPKAAIALGAAERVLPLADIGAAVGVYAAA